MSETNSQIDKKPLNGQPKEQDENLTFFNVMPKVNNDNMVAPKISAAVKPQESVRTTQPAILSQTSDGQAAADAQNLTSDLASHRGFFSRNKLYVILAIVLIGLAPVAYYFIPKYFAGNYQEENFLATNLPAVKSQSDLKSDWLIKYFNKTQCDKAVCGEEADPDLDGLANTKEYDLKTDPNNPDSDNDGLSDGDEVSIFSSNPLNSHTGVNPAYSDPDYIKGGYDFKTDKPLSDEQIKIYTDLMKAGGLHQPTLTTLEKSLLQIYHFDGSALNSATTTPESIKTASSSQSSLPKDLDQSPEAKQDRDTQRSLTIKSIGIALVKYFNDHQSYPATTDFKQMHDSVKVYLKVASNAFDPVNVEPYVYAYTPSSDKKNFSLTYYSETLNQLIKKTAADATADKSKEESAAFDEQRRNDLESIRSALLIYSADNVSANQEYVFPVKDKYKTALVPKYLSSVPKDPKTLAEYEYQVSENFDTFTIKSVFEAPPGGKTGYMCNQEECREY